MSARMRIQLGSAALISAHLIALSSPARADECLAAPNNPAPKDSHWYYRTDRTQQRKCWYLGAASQSSQQRPEQTAREAPAANQYSLENFKDFMTQRGNSNVSDKDVEKLYAEFLEWSRARHAF